MKLYVFSKTECGPCVLIKKFFKAMEDSRTESIREILLDDGQTENIDFARKYFVSATPTLLVVDDNDELVEQYIGGVPITQNIKSLLDKYV